MSLEIISKKKTIWSNGRICLSSRCRKSNETIDTQVENCLKSGKGLNGIKSYYLTKSQAQTLVSSSTCLYLACILLWIQIEKKLRTFQRKMILPTAMHIL